MRLSLKPVKIKPINLPLYSKKFAIGAALAFNLKISAIGHWLN